MVAAGEWLPKRGKSLPAPFFFCLSSFPSPQTLPEIHFLEHTTRCCHLTFRGWRDVKATSLSAELLPSQPITTTACLSSVCHLCQTRIRMWCRPCNGHLLWSWIFWAPEINTLSQRSMNFGSISKFLKKWNWNQTKTHYLCTHREIQDLKKKEISLKTDLHWFGIESGCLLQLFWTPSKLRANALHKVATWGTYSILFWGFICDGAVYCKQLADKAEGPQLFRFFLCKSA